MEIFELENPIPLPSNLAPLTMAQKGKIGQVTYREFVPGVPLVLPHEVAVPGGRAVSTEGVFRELMERHKEEFWRFVSEGLGLPRGASSREIALALRSLMQEAEVSLEGLFEGDLWDPEGLERFVRGVLRLLPSRDVFALQPDVAAWLLERFPPVNLLIGLDEGARQRYGPSDLLALSEYSEPQEHWEALKAWMREELRPEHFVDQPLAVLVVPRRDLPLFGEARDGGAPSRPFGRMLMGELPRGEGGQFPRLRYLLVLLKGKVELEAFRGLWRRFVRLRRDFGRRLVNSLQGYWGRGPFSVHSFFEAGLHQGLLEELDLLLRGLKAEGAPEGLLRPLELLRRGYHLALQLPDGRFVTCSAWSWASYSFRGGRGFPTPLSCHVEGDWLARELLLELYRRSGGEEGSLEEVLEELMGQGRASEDLSQVLFPEVAEARRVEPEGPVYIEGPLAGRLKRYRGNPILEPVREHRWESLFVFNPAAVRLQGKVFLLYRAMGEDWVSRIGLAISEDGLGVLQRLPEPIFWPEERWEEKGCEDPRVVVMEGRLWMLYTAYSGTLAQIALASISVDDFLAGRWSRWQRHGLLFPGVANKDAVLFPERVGGKYVLLHRVEPAIWISASDRLQCPWPTEGHRILVGPRSGLLWDGVKVGAGAQPLKTRHGWLLIYHGVDYRSVYRLGVLLLDSEEPERVIWRSPNPILEPEEPYECNPQGCQVPNVVFTCGALPKEEREVLQDDDEVLVYYGAADTVVSVATAKVSDLIPWPHGVIRWSRQGRSWPS